jgi:hypothetical protein
MCSPLNTWGKSFNVVRIVLVAGPCVWVGKSYVLKHKLMTGTWIVLTGNGPLCIGGCGVRGIFSAYVRRLLISIILWDGHSPTGW